MRPGTVARFFVLKRVLLFFLCTGRFLPGNKGQNFRPSREFWCHLSTRLDPIQHLNIEYPGIRGGGGVLPHVELYGNAH